MKLVHGIIHDLLKETLLTAGTGLSQHAFSENEQARERVRVGRHLHHSAWVLQMDLNCGWAFRRTAVDQQRTYLFVLCHMTCSHSGCLSCPTNECIEASPQCNRIGVVSYEDTSRRTIRDQMKLVAMRLRGAKAVVVAKILLPAVAWAAPALTDGPHHFQCAAFGMKVCALLCSAQDRLM